MRNLLNESFSRLIKTKSFRVCLILCIVFPILMISISKILTQTFDADAAISSDDVLFFLTGTLPLFIAISPGFFISKDFQQNTIRNKIVGGYSRTSIYMANWITCASITMIFHIVSTLVATGLAGILFEVGDIFTKENAYYSLVCIPVLLSFTSITVTMTMAMRGTAGAIFSYLIHELSAMFSFFAIFIENEAVAKFINYFVPMSQLSMITSRNYHFGAVDVMTEEMDLSDMSRYVIPEGFDAVAIPLYATLLLVAVTALGIWHFNKKDVK